MLCQVFLPVSHIYGGMRGSTSFRCLKRASTRSARAHQRTGLSLRTKCELTCDLGILNERGYAGGRLDAHQDHRRLGGARAAAQRQSRTSTRFWSLAHPFPPAIARQAIVTVVSLPPAARRRQGDVLADKVVCEDLCWQH